MEIPKQNITRMGFSVRVANARYTEWRRWTPNCVADWTPGGLVAQELYDHHGDTGLTTSAFDNFEYENLAYQKGMATNVTRLSKLIYDQFSGNTGC